MKTIISHTIAFVVGVVVGAVGIHALGDSEPRNIADQVAVRQVSGAKIEHRDVRADNRAISFRTVAKGEGEAVTEIPATAVPAARDWLERRNVIQPMIGYEYGRDGGRALFGAMYLRRKGPFAAGGGVIGSADRVGVLATFHYAF